MTTAKILITGATGTIGTALAQQLSAQGVRFRAMVRTADEQAGKLRALPGAEIVIADFNDPRSIARALEGMEKAFLLTNSSAQAGQLQSDFVKMAAGSSVQHIVKLSQLHADPQSPVRFLRYHAEVEALIRSSGMDYTFLRPNLFMQGLLGFRETIIRQNKFFATAGSAPISIVDIRDIAAVAAAALTRPGHTNKIYNITGPESLTHTELAAQLSTAMGRSINYINVSDEDLQNALLQAGFPAWQAEGLLEDYAHYARGEAAAVSPAVQEITGHVPRSFSQFAVDYATLLS
ncbi:SDR family oxidoreductase [Chitinophaga sp. 22321]|uniref:SDR family oxidoreductase n=1 Tax=Chitinophaga hostae TaxID=2831022 RepID=A0ABS5J952_9BACT|nr:SDR family oxidoreductase [Chitinophaga hostae]MBS0031573.1 SDR family oxidoreductase [Chitinophaga hostae]